MGDLVTTAARAATAGSIGLTAIARRIERGVVAQLKSPVPTPQVPLRDMVVMQAGSYRQPAIAKLVKVPDHSPQAMSMAKFEAQQGKMMKDFAARERFETALSARLGAVALGGLAAAIHVYQAREAVAQGKESAAWAYRAAAVGDGLTVASHFVAKYRVAMLAVGAAGSLVGGSVGESLK